MLWDSKIYLGEAFFNEIIRHPVPLDMNTLTALKRFFAGPRLVPLAGCTGPSRFALRYVSPGGRCTASSGHTRTTPSTKKTVQNFRIKVLRELQKIKLAWPELNYSTAKGVLILLPSKPAIAPTTGPQRLVE